MKKIKWTISIVLAIMLVVAWNVPAVWSGYWVYYGKATVDTAIRSGAGFNCTVLAEIKREDEVEITSELNSMWLKAKYTDAQNKRYEGYVYRSHFTFQKVWNNETNDALTKTTLSSVKWDNKKKMVIVKWEKNTTGYRFEIQFSSEKNFEFVRQFYIEDNTDTSVSIDSVPEGKWYVRIRTISESEFSDWSEVKSVNIPIVSPDVSVSKASSPQKGWLKVKWKAVKGISGYQLQVSESKDFKTGKQKKSNLSAKEKDVTMSGLKSKKTYYARLRTYKKNGSKTYYGEWSKAKSVKVK